MSGEACVLLLTHSLGPEVLGTFDRLERELGSQFDVWLLVHDAEQVTQQVEGRRVFQFSSSVVQELGFRTIRPTVVPGSAHLPLFLFARACPRYAFYWVIEYDVEFTGSWPELLTAHSRDSHLLTCHLRYRSQTNNWGWWQWLSHPRIPNPEVQVRSFNPIYRLTRSAIECLDAEFRSGWSGHFEATLSTLLHANGFRIEEIGGRGPFVQSQYHDRFYSPTVERSDGWLTGSMRYRPPWMRQELQPGLLYHPVKPADFVETMPIPTVEDEDP